jgi:hypothetical protein
MLGFHVTLNGRPLCLAGVGESGVLTAIVSVRLQSGDPAPEPVTLEVGGLSDGAHVHWPGSELSVGDEVVIRLVETATSDLPTRTVRDDPAVMAARERAYYERLKAKYEQA